MIVRIRSRVGTWRVEVPSKSTISDLVSTVQREHGITVDSLSLKPKGPDLAGESTTPLADLGIVKGTMLHLEFSGEPRVSVQGGAKVSKKIDAKGNLVAEAKKSDSSSFRPGLHALRNQKLHWTLTDMVELDNQYTFNIKGEQRGFCAQASLDSGACNLFQDYVRQFAFQKPRCGYMYGRFITLDEVKESELKKKKKTSFKKQMKLDDLDFAEELAANQGVKVEAIYEPKQTCKHGYFEILEDPHEAKVDAIAKSLGLQRVGFIFSHAAREGYTFSAHEVINSAHQALEATEGALDSPFAVVKVSPDESGNASFDAFSLTPQCIEMVAEDALVVMHDNPGHSAVHETFTAVVEAKAASVIDNDFFIKRVPIVSHSSPYSGDFPRANREDGPKPSSQALQRALSSLPRDPSSKDLAKKLSDFHLLVYLGEMFDVNDGLKQICQCVKSVVEGKSDAKTPSLENGYKMMILSMAGMSI